MDKNRQYNLIEVLEMSKDPEVIELISAKYVFHNYKVLVKEKILHQDLSALYILVPGMDIDGLRNKLSREEKSEVPGFINEALDDYEKNHDAQRIDLILDRAYYEEILKKALEALNLEGDETLIVPQDKQAMVKGLIPLSEESCDVGFIIEKKGIRYNYQFDELADY